MSTCGIPEISIDLKWNIVLDVVSIDFLKHWSTKTLLTFVFLFQLTLHLTCTAYYVKNEFSFFPDLRTSRKSCRKIKMALFKNWGIDWSKKCVTVEICIFISVFKTFKLVSFFFSAWIKSYLHSLLRENRFLLIYASALKKNQHSALIKLKNLLGIIKKNKWRWKFVFLYNTMIDCWYYFFKTQKC